MPRHKGKVERGVGYVQDNSLKAREFPVAGGAEPASGALGAEHRRHADSRHDQAAGGQGVSRSRAGGALAAAGRAVPLLPRGPADRQPRRSRRSRQGLLLGAAGVSGPHGLGALGPRLVRIFNHRLEQIALHVRREPGKFSTLSEHLVPEKISGVERGAAWLLSQDRGPRRAGPCLGGGDAENPRNRGGSRAARAAELDYAASLRGDRRGLRNGPFLRRVSAADASAATQATRPCSRTAAVSRRASDHSPLDRLRRLAARRPGWLPGVEPAGPPGSFPRTPNLLPLFSDPCVLMFLNPLGDLRP